MTFDLQVPPTTGLASDDYCDAAKAACVIVRLWHTHTYTHTH